jgi:hypothetical protein
MCLKMCLTVHSPQKQCETQSTASKIELGPITSPSGVLQGASVPQLPSISYGARLLIELKTYFAVAVLPGPSDLQK